MHEPMRPELEAKEFTPMRAALWMLGALIVMLTSALLLFSLDPAAQNDQVSLGAISAAAFLFVSALLVGAYPAGPRVSQALGLRKTHPLAIPCGLVIGALVQVPAERISGWIDLLAPLSMEDQAARAELFIADTKLQAVGLVLVLCLLIPFAEEAFFRGAVYGALRREKTSQWLASLVVGFGFMIGHMNVRLLLPIGLVALVLGILRAASGSLYPAIFAHMAFNAVTVVSHLMGFNFPRLGLLAELTVSAVVVLLLLLVVRLAKGHAGAQESIAQELSRPQELKASRGTSY
jgi:membrane protease YdiL (CAAX protease family)